MPTVQETVAHSERSRRNNFEYQFTTKHHGGAGSSGQAQWVSEVTFEEEFSIFETADLQEIADSTGNLFGILRGLEGLREIGIWHEQIAIFPFSGSGSWHGYPSCPLASGFGPQNRQGQRSMPERLVLNRLRDQGLVTGREWKKFCKGDTCI